MIPVCTCMDTLVPLIQSQAGREMSNVEFYKVHSQHDTKNSSGLSDVDNSVLENAEIVLGDSPFIARNLGLFKKVKWIQSTFAGVETIVSEYTAAAPNFILTRQVGNAFGQQMGEYVLVQIMARERNLFGLECDMQQKKWQWRNWAPRVLPSLSVGILGVGVIGRRIAQMCKAVEMEVWGLTRTRQDTPFVDHCHQLDELPCLLESCDYVCNTLPSTPHTKGMLNGDMLKHCAARKSVLINVGRGDVVSEESIIHAISKGWLGGAILDVFETEPLPEDSPLWTTPGVTITPHMSGLSTASEVASAFLENLKHYLTGQPLKNMVDFSHGY